MKFSIHFCFYLALFFVLIQCKKQEVIVQKTSNNTKLIKYAKGFELTNYKGFSVLKIKNPWPNATKKYTYVLKEKNGIIPDSLQSFLTISVPIKSVIVTSTTHIPSLEMLHVENSLIGFPNLNYISSEKTRALIDAKKINDVGNNETLNTEKIIDLQPQILVAFGIDNNNPTLDNLEKSGIKVLLNGDWNEQSPLGKAEWIKFFGALYCKQNLANSLFEKIEKDYQKTLAIAKKATSKPTILAGDMFGDKWYLPQGSSWGGQFLEQANGNYLWSNTNGTGSLSLSFETVFDKAKNADFWICSGSFSNLGAMAKSNPHFTEFKAFQNKNVYSFSLKKGKTGGVLYYELAPNRPDIVLKDIVKILHPELLIGYKPFFFEKLK